jgi:hypothetical protein
MDLPAPQYLGGPFLRAGDYFSAGVYGDRFQACDNGSWPAALALAGGSSSPTILAPLVVRVISRPLALRLGIAAPSATRGGRLVPAPSSGPFLCATINDFQPFAFHPPTRGGPLPLRSLVTPPILRDRLSAISFTKGAVRRGGSIRHLGHHQARWPTAR